MSVNSASNKKNNNGSERRQYATFYLQDRLYGIDVTQVQEVTKPMPLTLIRLAPNYIKGLINLRGQIATAIGLKELFGLADTESEEKMTVVCRLEGSLLSLLVDKIGDVMEVSKENFEPAPENLDDQIKKFMEGVYKTQGSILSVIDVENISKEINKIN